MAHPYKDKIPGGMADKKKPSDFDPKQLESGRMVEMEHVDDPALAREIAMDHLTEDPDYYKKLRVMEKEAADQYEGIDFTPPESVANAAAKGLEYRRKASPSNRGGLTNEEAAKEGIGSGVQRAVNLENRDPLSPKVVRQMHAFFSRHEKNKGIAAEHKDEPWNDKGYVAWLLWGGDPGQTWAAKVVGQMDAADVKSKKVAAYWKSARTDVINEGQIEQFRQDALALAKAGERAATLDQIDQVVRGCRRWGKLFEHYLASIRQELESRLRIAEKPDLYRTTMQEGESVADASWVKWYLDNMKPVWEFQWEMRNVPERAGVPSTFEEPAALRARLVEWYVKERGYTTQDAEREMDDYFMRRPPQTRAEAEAEAADAWREKARKWAARVRKKARDAWKYLGDLARWSTSWQGGRIPVSVVVPEVERVQLEGFQLIFRGFDESPYKEELGAVKAGMAAYKQKANRYAPILLAHQVPVSIEWTFEPTTSGSAAAYYERGLVHVTPWAIKRDLNDFVRMMAHEMGHHLHKTVLTKKATLAWGQFIRGDYTRLDLRDAVKVMSRLGVSSTIDDKLSQEEPILALQLQTLLHSPTYKHVADFLFLDKIEAYLAAGKDPVVAVPASPITGYAGKNDEEAFCEALGMLVGYGPRAVLPQVRAMLGAVVPRGVKTAGGSGFAVDPKAIFDALEEITRDPKNYGVSKDGQSQLDELSKVLGELSGGQATSSGDKKASVSLALGIAVSGVKMLTAGVKAARALADHVGVGSDNLTPFLKATAGAGYTFACLGAASILCKIAPKHPIAAHANNYDRLLQSAAKDRKVLDRMTGKVNHIVRSMGDKDMSASLAMITNVLMKIGVMKPPKTISDKVVTKSLAMHHALQDFYDAIHGNPIGSSKSESNSDKPRTYDDYRKEKEQKGGEVMGKGEWEARYRSARNGHHPRKAKTFWTPVSDGTSVGIFLRMPPELEAQFPPKAEDTSPPHCTLLIVGDVAEDREPEMVAVIESVLQTIPPTVRLWLNGVDEFIHPGGDRRVFYTPVRFSIDMATVRDRLRAALMDAGFEVTDRFPLAYNSHATLGYVPDAHTARWDGPVPDGAWTINHVEVWGARKHHIIQFGGSQYVPPTLAAMRRAAIEARVKAAVRKYWLER